MNSSAPLVACPHCGKESRWDINNAFRPFCCERCKMTDLGKWANEEYSVALPDTEQEFSAPPYQA
ncbi:MAG: DNA gyrase inhibitor YacG [Gallionella sp.]|nr:DNA gyrase inhibitor YacG [Gallionella sp.]MDD4947075.1 DNA gyrase inhibitor YacG [Gallionella sp.]MDD5613034.1 DNA gyrase inhibitor YacG [Gallionella sp.]